MPIVWVHHSRLFQCGVSLQRASGFQPCVCVSISSFMTSLAGSLKSAAGQQDIKLKYFKPNKIHFKSII